MEEKKINLLPENTEAPIEANPEPEPSPSKPSFFQRAFNRTKEAIRNVDEAITGRDAFKRLEERLQNHTDLIQIQNELHEELKSELSSLGEIAQTEMKKLNERLDKEVETLVTASAEQRTTFERTLSEVTATVTALHNTATELRTTANAAQEALSTANNQQQEMQRQASSHLARWNNDSETLKTDVRNLQSQLQQLQQSFKHFFLTAMVGFIVLTAIIGYLLFK
jgi:chromosome segregation ATPase